MNGRSVSVVEIGNPVSHAIQTYVLGLCQGDLESFLEIWAKMVLTGDSRLPTLILILTRTFLSNNPTGIAI